MRVYRAEWPDDSDCDYHLRVFNTLKKAQDFARKKSEAKVYLVTYAIESEADKDLRQWVYTAGGLSYTESL